jgi:hypothetical protein
MTPSPIIGRYFFTRLSPGLYPFAARSRAASSASFWPGTLPWRRASDRVRRELARSLDALLIGEGQVFRQPGPRFGERLHHAANGFLGAREDAVEELAARLAPAIAGIFLRRVCGAGVGIARDALALQLVLVLFELVIVALKHARACAGIARRCVDALDNRIGLQERRRFPAADRVAERVSDRRGLVEKIEETRRAAFPAGKEIGQPGRATTVSHKLPPSS